MQRAAFMGARHDVVQLVSGAATSLESVAQVEVFKTGPQRKVAAQQIHSVHTARIGKDDVILRWASATRTYPVHVVAHAAVQGVDGTVTASTVEAPVARREHVVSVAADDAVRAVAAIKSVVPGEAFDGVVAAEPVHGVAAGCADEMIVAIGASDRQRTVLHHETRGGQDRRALEESDQVRDVPPVAVEVIEQLAGGGVVDDPVLGVLPPGSARGRVKAVVVFSEPA